MTDHQPVIDIAERAFREHLTQQVRIGVLDGKFPHDLWDRLQETGLTAAAVSEARGGFGLPLEGCCALARIAGRFAAPVPLIEAFLAETLLAGAHLKPVRGVACVLPAFWHGSITLRRSGGQVLLSGTVTGIPWLAHATHLVAVAAEDERPITVCIPGPFDAKPSENVAGEPTGAVTFNNTPIAHDLVGSPGDGVSSFALHAKGALFRCAQMVGSMQTVLEMTTNHAKERIQFGRPIGKFQAVQQQLAVMASEIVAAECALGAAVEAAQAGHGDFEIAVAKSRLGKAVNVTLDVSHQIHGAIGTTREFPLHHCTMRLAMWRNEYGTPNEWSQRIGETVARLGGSELWPYLTAAAR